MYKGMVEINKLISHININFHLLENDRGRGLIESPGVFKPFISRQLQVRLVAGAGFEPATFGL